MEPQPQPQVVEVAAGEPPPRRSRGAMIGAIVGVIALLAAGAFALVKITGNDDDGGAASPVDAGTEFIEALGNEDILGVVDLLLPGERQTLREPLVDLIDDLVRLEVLSDDATLDKVGGVDLQFTDIEVDEESTSADDIVNLTISGAASIVIDGTAVPIGDLLVEDVFDGERPDLDADEETSEFGDLPITVVERDGRWYVSAAYTVAEILRTRDGADIPESGVDAAGADEPELAVDEMLDAIADQDLEQLIGLLDPTEAEALQRYAPLFLDVAQDEVDAAGVDIEITDREYTVDGSGSRRSIGVESLTFRASDGLSEFEFTYADGCVSGEIDGEPQEFCGVRSGDIDGLSDGLGIGDPEAAQDLFDTLSDVFDDYAPTGIAVHQVDGQWYVSPLRTGFDAIDSVFDALDRNEINDIIDAFTTFFDSMSGSF